MRWVLGTLIASSRHARLRPLELFGDGEPKLAQEEVKAIAGLWKTQVEFDDRYNADLSLYLDPSGRVVALDDELPYNLDPESLGWSWWSADRMVVAGAEGDNELSLSLQLGHLRLEGRGERVDFRCWEFVGEVQYEGADADPTGSFAMQLSLPMKTDVTVLEERYQARIAARPPPPPVFPYSDFVGRWFMGLTEDEAPGTVYFPVDLATNGSWESIRTMPKLTGTWGVCSGGAASHGGGPEVEPMGSSVWFSFDGTSGNSVHLQGKPILKPGQAEELEAVRSCGVGAPPVADQVDGRMWEGGEGGGSSLEREYFGEFRLLRESALTDILIAKKAEKEAALASKIAEKERRRERAQMIAEVCYKKPQP